MAIIMTVNQLRTALKPLFGLCPIQVQIMPCLPWNTAHARPRPVLADIVGLPVCSTAGTVTIEVQKPHDC